MDIELGSDEQGDIIREKLPAEKIGKNQFRLMGSPGFIGNLAYGDEVELDSEDPLGYRLLERGGYVCVQTRFARKPSDADVEKINALLKPLEGWVDGSMSDGKEFLVVLTIPAWSTFPKIEQALEQISRRFPMKSWMYGNVYDPVDGETPLDWWE